jgi:plastocyanin
MKNRSMHGMRSWVRITVGALALLSVAATAAESPNSVVVEIRDFAFVPATLAVHPGTTVTWKNFDDEPHSVVSDAGAFRSGALDTNESFSYTFSKAGTFRFVCSLHSHMTGVVRVE